MKISKYGVTLSRLTEDKIELVRNWRNDPKISQFMEYRETITREMQLNWFHKINNDNNYFFIIEVDGVEIGLINIRDINYDRKEGEAGLFIFLDNFSNSDISFRSTITLNDFCFEKLGLCLIKAHILSDNKISILFNKLIGYKKVQGQEQVFNELYTLSQENYYKYRVKILSSLK